MREQKTYRADPNDHDAVARALLEKYQDQQVHQTIELEDHDQDFLEWDLDEDGQVIDCRPFQSSVWTRYRVLNHMQLTAGCNLVLEGADGRRFILKHPVAAVRKGGA